MSTTIPSGSRIAFKVNGVKVAFATGVSFDVSYSTVPIQVLDQPDVVEHVETGYDVSFSAAKFRVPNKSLKQLGIEPSLETLLTRPELEAEIYDRISNVTLVRFIGVKLSGNSSAANARDVMSENLTFVARKAVDESGT
ncbi:unnamed protein product [marine sediment metagenome]|uniref:Uncharacterized protein n=1 Tax=marine sediment metagenome TaxID=412755 RepID=X0TGE7_9ZZZZ